MARRKRIRIHWLFWTTLLAMFAVIFGAVFGSAWLTIKLTPGMKFEYDWESQLLSRSFDVLLGLWFVVVGSSIGSFLNVVAYRLPRRLSINGFSRCPYCQCDIQGYDNIPILAWIRLRGRCRSCRLPIAARYIGFEALGGWIAFLLFAFEFMTHGANVPNTLVTGNPFGTLMGRMDWVSLYRALSHLILVYFLVAAAMIHWGNQLVPRKLFMVGALAWFAAALVQPDLMPVSWRTVPASASEPAFPFDRIETSLTMLLGGLAGMLWGLATSLVELIGLWGRRRSAVLPAWIASWSLIGLSLGWQAIFSVGLLALALNTLVLALQRIRGRDATLRNVAWLWCAYLLHLFSWSFNDRLAWWPGQDKPWWIYLSALGIAGLVSMLIQDDSPSEVPSVPTTTAREQSQAPEIDQEAIT